MLSQLQEGKTLSQLQEGRVSSLSHCWTSSSDSDQTGSEHLRALTAADYNRRTRKGSPDEPSDPVFICSDIAHTLPAGLRIII